MITFSSTVLGDLWDRPEDQDGLVDFGPVTNTAIDLLLLASLVPFVLIAVGWIGRRPAGTASSVTGGLRWRWLGVCVLVALPVLALSCAAVLLLPGQDVAPSGWAPWEVFLPALAMLVVLVPLQSAAEEYLFRGWLLQSVGAFFRSPWCAVAPQAVLFAAAHGWGTLWGFAELVVFGMLAGWLTVRTGGLEATIGLHAVNNLLAFGLSAAVVDGLSSDETAADAALPTVMLDLAGVALYTAAVLWFARRRPPLRTAPAPEALPAPPSFECSASPAYAPAGHTAWPRPPAAAPHAAPTHAPAPYAAPGSRESAGRPSAHEPHQEHFEHPGHP
ncbi:CPBP family intramembrane glutamic endopeptidase [Streptomyces sp. NPDC021356]|uniref:CPBP family intramembrane glutamic endopeptidase n=1 Tax=Streptomyces sp. NPDC021356 TaxID=3154900 RepID=UPI0033DE170C